MRVAWRIVAGLLVILVLILVILPAGRVALGALLLLPEFFPGVPVRPLEWITPAPRRSAIQLTYDGRQAVADLYDPGTPGPHGAVVIFLGVAPAGLDDPRVVRLGEGLARMGVVTLVPQSQDLVNSRVDPTEIDEVVAGFNALATRPDVDANRVGLGGFCIGASLSLDAAEDPRISQRVAFVNSFTGYFDLESYMVSILSHSVEPVPPAPSRAREPWEPSAQATTVLDENLTSLDPIAAEATLLRAAALDPKAQRPNVSSLSPTGRTIWDLITTTDPTTAEKLFADLPPPDQQELARLSPNGHLDDLYAKIFIMHDRNDTSVPYVQSRLLAEHLRPGQGEYDEFTFFNHVDPTASVSPIVFVRDSARLSWHMYQILAILKGIAPVTKYGI